MYISAIFLKYFNLFFLLEDKLIYKLLGFLSV